MSSVSLSEEGKHKAVSLVFPWLSVSVSAQVSKVEDLPTENHSKQHENQSKRVEVIIVRPSLPWTHWASDTLAGYHAAATQEERTLLKTVVQK